MRYYSLYSASFPGLSAEGGGQGQQERRDGRRAAGRLPCGRQALCQAPRDGESRGHTRRGAGHVRPVDGQAERGRPPRVRGVVPQGDHGQDGDVFRALRVFHLPPVGPIEVDGGAAVGAAADPHADADHGQLRQAGLPGGHRLRRGARRQVPRQGWVHQSSLPDLKSDLGRI